MQSSLTLRPAYVWLQRSRAAELLTDVATFERVILSYLDKMYFDGRPAPHGEKLLAGICFCLPHLGKNAVPSKSRLPLPWLPLMAIVSRLLVNRWELAMATVLGFHCYLRPFELEGLRASQLVAAADPNHGQLFKVGLILAPRELGNPSKTGNWEEAVLIDQLPLLIRPLLALKKRGEQSDGCLWSFEIGALTAALKEMGKDSHLEGFGISAYSLRHGGASHDLLCGYRTLQEVKRRGRWAAGASLRGYSKETRLIEVMSRVPQTTIDLGNLTHQRLDVDIAGLMPPAIAKFSVGI